MKDLADKFQAIAYRARAIRFVGVDDKYVKWLETQAMLLERPGMLGSIIGQ